MNPVNLHTYWSELASGYTDDAQQVSRLWQEIETAHSQPGRYYHTLKHLEFMAAHYEANRKQLEDPDAFLFALFYHDIVYNTLRQNNERKSAEKAQQRLPALNVPAERVARCVNLVMATKGHAESSDNDTRYFVDTDLAILGEDPVTYRNYARNVRKEYAFYPDRIYNNGRKKVLTRFLSMPRIFKTDMFYNQYEMQARENMKEELSAL